MKGFCLPGLGGASAIASMDGVRVAVKRHVCRSFGRTLKRCDSSGANVGVSSRSASSRTLERISDVNALIRASYQKLDSGKIPFIDGTPEMINNPARSRNDDMWPIAKFQGLGHHIHSTHDNSCSYVKGRSQDGKLLRDLEGQLSIRRHQRYSRGARGTSTLSASARAQISRMGLLIASAG